MPLPIQQFQQIVDQQATAVNANSNPIFNLSPGSVILALLESNAANSIWLQAIATTLLSVTRLSTSSGTDVDTFIQDFGFTRPPGNPASGNVTFSRFTTTVQGKVPVGAIVSDSSNNLTFIVTLDTSNPNYDADSNSYIVAISTASMTVPVACTIAGIIGNVVAGAIDTINNQALTPGIDTVSNSSAFTNGADPASDTQTKQDFVLYIQSQSKATLQAIEYAVSTSVNGSEIVARYNIVENVNESNVTQLGYFYVVVDNGTGSPPSNQLIATVSANVENYRGLTIQYNIDKAQFTAVTIHVWVKLVTNPTETQSQITTNITSALQQYAASIPFEQNFIYSKIAEVVYNSDANIASLPSSNPPTLNSGTSDLPAVDNLHVFGIPTVTVTYL